MLAVADPAPSVVAQVDRASAGNPLFAAEYLRAAVHAGLLTRDQDGRWLVPAAIAGELPLPRTVLELLEERLARLSASGAELAGVASIAGKEMESSVLAAASTLSETAALDALAELIAARILEAEGPRVSFTHDKVREAALARLSAVDAAAIHLRVAEVLDRSSGASAALLETIAAHFEQGGDRARARPPRASGSRAPVARARGGRRALPRARRARCRRPASARAPSRSTSPSSWRTSAAGRTAPGGAPSRTRRSRRLARARRTFEHAFIS
ncbi:MAG: hypothetical protein U0166_18735 [Acidobacteriota bacterium]